MIEITALQCFGLVLIGVGIGIILEAVFFSFPTSAPLNTKGEWNQ